MSDSGIQPLTAEEYNYAEFTLAAHEGLNTWEQTPAPGKRAPDYPLWREADHGEVMLRELLGQHDLTIVEFGSLT